MLPLRGLIRALALGKNGIASDLSQ